MQKPNMTFVDAEDKVIGAGTRDEMIAHGHVHRIARVFLLNSRGEVLIQKRAANHRSLPGRWDQSAAGHVDEGEDYPTAAHREMAEEVGVDSVELTDAGRYYTEEHDEPWVKKRWNGLFIGRYDGEVQIDGHEVTDSRWIAPNALRAWMKQEPEEFTEGFIKCFDFYFK